ncbi:tail fiber protein [Aureisphaera galaxeae]|uniref:phage tail protein n=1 Tax=Aureisphaera galaxeae TaxID=1538023 RepID=UPI002350F0DD|nr:tail fiber protein [Aureisphaera galaxeae]MDC8004523.1 tail fiber protein [Aureisphaera galaxeae]
MDPFIGQIMPVGFNFAPRGWAFCHGQLLAIASHTALFSLLGTTFGGDGRTTFGLPDSRGRSFVGVGSGPGLAPITWGERAGAENHTITIGQLPSHTHNIGVSTATGEETNPAGKHIAAMTDAYAEDANANLAPPASVGSNQSFSIRNPFLGVYYVIALEGVYPSRS